MRTVSSIAMTPSRLRTTSLPARAPILKQSQPYEPRERRRRIPSGLGHTSRLVLNRALLAFLAVRSDREPSPPWSFVLRSPWTLHAGRMHEALVPSTALRCSDLQQVQYSVPAAEDKGRTAAQERRGRRLVRWCPYILPCGKGHKGDQGPPPEMQSQFACLPVASRQDLLQQSSLFSFKLAGLFAACTTTTQRCLAHDFSAPIDCTISHHPPSSTIPVPPLGADKAILWRTPLCTVHSLGCSPLQPD